VLVAFAACGDDGRLPIAPHCAIDLPARGALHASGTQLQDALGRTITLRGVDAGGRAKFAPYAPFDFDPSTPGDHEAKLGAYLDRAAGWGIDLLRVTYSWQAAEPSSGAPDSAYLARFDALLDGAAARGLWTIVDFHQDVYAEPYCGDGFPAWTLAAPPAPHHDCPDWSSEYDGDSDVRAAFDALWANTGGVRDHYRAHWAALAAHEAGKPGVIGFEPINEPYPGTADRETWEQQTLAPFYADLAGVIRGAAPDALVFVDTTGYEGVLSSTGLPKPAGDGIVLAPHSYDARALFGGKPDPDVQGRLAHWSSLAQTWNTPLVIGELGIPVDNPFAAPHARATWAALDALAIAGGAWWEYSVSADLWNGEHFSIVNADGSETPIVDELVRPYARALAGTDATTTYDPGAKRFAITYVPTAGGGPTELVAPSRATWRVGAVGACVDTRPGLVLVQPEPGISQVSVSIE
jgi:endoglycosylceramidase